jgi:TonB-dependent SusC/RagA subfamily outer membrane receptor
MKSSVAVFMALALGCAHRSPEREAAGPPPEPTRPTGSTVSATDFGQKNPASVEQMLAGRISGVTVTPAPGGGIAVRMMNTGGSFYSGTEPLIVVDGVAVNPGPNGTLGWLNPRDIESITALKDPSQTAIYGVRGANGVIVIKTKGAR